MPLGEVVPAVPYKVGLLVPQEGKNRRFLVQRSIYLRDIAQGVSF